MPAKTKSVVSVAPAVLEARRELAHRIASITGAAGEHVTAIPGVILYRREDTTPCYRASYEPSLSIFVQGLKHVILGETEYVCDSSSFLLSSIDVPAQSQIVEASAKVPLLVMFLRFDMPVVWECLVKKTCMRLNPPLTDRGWQWVRLHSDWLAPAIGCSISWIPPRTYLSLAH
jgi:hypothetical protein